MNPYFEERIVAFIDILGFKEKVKRSLEDRDCAEALHSSLKYILQLRKDNENIQSFMSLKKFGLLFNYYDYLYHYRRKAPVCKGCGAFANDSKRA